MKEQEIAPVLRLQRELCADIMNSDDILKCHRDLCLNFKGRFTGSPDAEGASRYIIDQFRSMPLDGIEIDEFDCIAWQRGQIKATLTSPYNQVIPAIALPYSPGFSGIMNLLDAGTGSRDELDDIKQEIPGRTVLCDDLRPRGRPLLHRLQKYVAAYRAGADGFVFSGGAFGMLPPTGSLAFDHSKPIDQALPSIGIPRETACLIRECSHKYPVNIALEMTNTLAKSKDRNIIGWIDGSDPGSGILIFCAHYDAHDISQGAEDNASGSAIVMELARVLSKMKHLLRHRICFILFGGEEMGLLGSYSFVQNHRKWLPDIKFVFNIDCAGADGKLAVILQEDFQLESLFKSIARSMPSDIEIETDFMPYSDHFPFLMHGIPSAFCATSHLTFHSYAHTAADTFEKISVETLQRVASQIGRFGVRIDQHDKWPGRPVKRSVIMDDIKQKGYSDLLKFENHI